MLLDRVGPNPRRLATELDRLGTWAGTQGKVDEEDLASMVVDTSEAMIWDLSDAVIEGSQDRALTTAERLTAGQERAGSIVYQLGDRVRKAVRAEAGVRANRTPEEIRRELRLTPYPAKRLFAQVRRADAASLRRALCSVADLEHWTRGGADYPEEVALTLALLAATGDPD
jgi:DNA polymerase III delta subunit